MFIIKFWCSISCLVSLKQFVSIQNLGVGENAGYLSRHDSLSLHYEFTFGTLTVPPVAEALVSLQRRYETVVPTAGALGHPGGFRPFGRGHRSSGRGFALLLLAHLCWTSEDLIYRAECERVAAEVKRGAAEGHPAAPPCHRFGGKRERLEAGEETGTGLASICCTHSVSY